MIQLRELFKDLALRSLHTTERIYLRVNGWVEVEEDLWLTPPGHPKGPAEYRTSHAVNSQKYYTRTGGFL